MLKNAFLYEEEIKNAMYNVWYDPKYQYYFMGSYHNDFNLNHENGDWYCRCFASVDKDGNLLGHIGYKIDHEVSSATNFGAINFTNNIATFGHDLYQVVDDIFCKFQMNRLEFSVIIGNPIEKNYDKLVNMFGGRILCVRYDVAKDMAGNLCDDKSYEIMRKDYLAAKERRKYDK